MVILEDADLDAAVNAAAFGAFMNQGQICMSTERIIVDEKIADSFVAKLKTKVASLPVGDPRRNDVAIGAVVSLDAARHVERLAQDAVAKGATMVLDGGPAESAIRPPAIVDRVTADMALYAEVPLVRSSPSSGPPAKRRRFDWPTTPATACRRPCSAATSIAHSASLVASARYPPYQRPNRAG